MLPNTMIYAMLILIVALNMCKNNQNGDSSTTLLYVILIGGIIFTLNNNNNLINNTGNVETFDDSSSNEPYEQNVNININENESESVNGNENENENVGEYNNTNTSNELLKVDDLLPGNSDPVFGHPNISTTEVNEHFLDAGGIIGMMSQTLRNPNYDLRCAPTNPKVDVGPWMQSTIDADITRKPLEGEECGGCNKV